MSKEFKLTIRLPKWANWIGQNREGDWWVFACKPQPDKIHENWRHSLDDINEPCMRVAVETGPIADWKGTLEQVE